MPKISVIIPVYGVEKYIERCAESLFSQTLDDIEFIFIDDCSPDKSMEHLNATIEKNRYRFAERNWLVRTERMPKNSGQAAVRRYGLDLATGDFVIHCDSDDWVASNMYEVLYNKAVNEDADIVICRAYISDGTNHTFNPKTGFSENKIKYMELILLGVASRSLCMKLIRRSLFTDNPFLFPVADSGEDNTLSVQAIYYANKYVLLNEPYYYYYNNPHSTTTTPGVEACIRRYLGGRNNIDVIESFLGKVHLEDSLKDSIIRLKFRSRLNLYPALHEESAREYFKTSYPGITTKALLSKHIPIKEKILYIKACIKVLLCI